MMEGGLMKFFGKGTTTRLIEDPEEKREKLIKFFKDNIHNKYNIYYVGFVVCEFFNLVVVTFAVWMTDRFLNGQFMWYGFRVWTYYRYQNKYFYLILKRPYFDQNFPLFSLMCRTKLCSASI